MTMMDYTSKPRAVRLFLNGTATRPPGRGRSWTVEAGRWRAEGPTEKAAADALAANLTTFLTVYRPPVTLAYGGYHATVWADLGDGDNPVVWCIQTVRPDGRESGTWVTAAGWAEAEANARHNLAHLATDWHDDASVHAGAAYLAGCGKFGHGQYGPAELYRYAAWQRAAKAARDEGRDDWHEWASANQRQFGIPAKATTTEDVT